MLINTSLFARFLRDFHLGIFLNLEMHAASLCLQFRSISSIIGFMFQTYCQNRAILTVYYR